MPGLAQAGSPGMASAQDPGGGESFLTLQSGFTQSVWGVYPTFFGGVAFGPSGKVWVDECAFSGSPLVGFSQSQTYTQDQTNLHVSSVVPSNAGCGLTNGPGGYLYSNTSSGVTTLDATSGAQVGSPQGPPGNALGITVDPVTGDLVYVGEDCRFTGTCSIYSLDPATGTASIFATLPGYDFIDGVTFDPTGNYLLVSTRAPFYALTIINRSGQVVQNVMMNSEPDGIAFHQNPDFVLTNDTDGTMTSFTFPAGNLTATPSVSLFASGGFRGDLALVASDGCMYLSQNGVRFNDGTSGYEDSIVRVCPGFVPSPGVNPTTVVFEHGINGNFFRIKNQTSPDFRALISKLRSEGHTVHVVPYYQDKGYLLPNGSCNPAMPPARTANLGGLYTNPKNPTSISQSVCDSEGALAYSTTELRHRIDSYSASSPAPIAVVANSMGGAITRGWLALAQQGQARLGNVKAVIFVQGAQAGSVVADVGTTISSSPLANLALELIMLVDGNLIPWNVNRPALWDLASNSQWYNSVNPLNVPSSLAYYNFTTDIQLALQINFFDLYTTTVASLNSGDGMMLPGSNNPTAEPPLGGEKFLPGNRNVPNRHQFHLRNTIGIDADAMTACLAGLLGPCSASALGGCLFGPPQGSAIGTCSAAILQAIEQIGGTNNYINDPIAHWNLPQNLTSPAARVAWCSGGGQVTPVVAISRLVSNPTNGCP